MNLEVRSPNAKSFDLEIEREGLFATVEFKKESSGAVSQWIVSGRAANGLPAIILSLILPVPIAQESLWEKSSIVLADEFIFPLARQLSATQGLSDRISPISVEMRQLIFEAHMKNHFTSLEITSHTLQAQTEALFGMASFLGVVGPLKKIAQFQGVSVSTVETRIKIGRSEGRVPKASEVRAKKGKTKRGVNAKKS